MIDPIGLAAQLLPLAENGDWGHHGDIDGGWWILMVIGMVLFWGLVALGIVWLVRELTSRGPRHGGEPKAEQILDRRLAEGEITVSEHAERRKALRDSG